MQKQNSGERSDYPKASPVRTSESVPHTGEAGAWESLGDDYWLPHRVRGSNRGRALG